jgi:TonB family protein
MKQLFLLILITISLGCYSQEKEVFIKVEHMPMFNGGDTTEFKKFVKQKLLYPKDAIKKAAYGRVAVLFVVESTGAVGQAQIVKGASPSLDSAAVRVVRNSPMWIPGFKNGKPVAVSRTITINFMLGPGKEVPAEIGDIICIPGAVETAAENTPAIQQEIINFFSEFYKWTSQRNQIQCDGFDGLLYKAKLKVSVDSKKELVYVVYDNNKSVMTTNTYEGRRSIKIFCNTPPGEIVTLLAIKVENGNTYLSFQRINPSIKEIFKLEYQQVDSQQLKDTLGKLKVSE